jgi:hypothetical protein
METGNANIGQHLHCDAHNGVSVKKACPLRPWECRFKQGIVIARSVDFGTAGV